MTLTMTKELFLEALREAWAGGRGSILADPFAGPDIVEAQFDKLISGQRAPAKAINSILHGDRENE